MLFQKGRMADWAIAATTALITFAGYGHAQASDACTKALEVSAIDGLLKSIATRLPKDNILSDSDLEKLRVAVVSKLTETKGAIFDVVYLRALKRKDLKYFPEYKTINIFVSQGIDYDPEIVSKSAPIRALGWNVSSTMLSFPPADKILESNQLFAFVELHCYVVK